MMPGRGKLALALTRTGIGVVCPNEANGTPEQLCGVWFSFGQTVTYLPSEI